MPVIPKPDSEPPLFGGGAQVIFGYRQPTPALPTPVDHDDAVPPMLSLIERWSSDEIDLASMKVPSAEPDA